MDTINSVFNINSDKLQADNEQNICSICLGVIAESDKAVTQCGHVFCLSCLLKNLKNVNTCPICRTELEEARQSEFKKLTIANTYNFIEEILENYDISLVLYLLKNTQGNSFINLTVHLRTIMVDLIRKLIIYQYKINDDEDEDDEDEDDEDDEEDTIGDI